MKTFVAALVLVTLPSTALAKGYRIGVFLPLSGGAAEKGKPFRNAIEIYAQEVNAAGGIKGHKLEVVFRDDQNDVEKAKQAAADFAADPDVLAVIGTYFAETAIGATKVLGDAKLVCVYPTIGTREIIDANPYMFSLNFRDEIQGSFIAVYLKEVLKKDNVLVIHSTDQAGMGLRAAFLEKASHIGLKVAQVIPTPKTIGSDFIATIRPDTSANQNIGAVVALTHSGAGQRFLPQLRKQGIHAPVLAPNTWTNPKFITDIDEKYTRDVYVMAPFLYEIANEKAGDFARAYKRIHRDLPPPSAALAFDSILLLAHALDALTDPPKGATPSRQGVRDWLANINWQNAVDGATGSLFFKNSSATTAEYVTKYYDELDQEAFAAAQKAQSDKRRQADVVAAPKVARAAQPPPTGEVRAVERDVFVSTIKDGRYNVAFTQLAYPREEYVLKELRDRVSKGYVTVVDGQPYHIINVIYTGVDVIKINDINTRDMNWDVDVFMWFKWNGDRLDAKEIDKLGIINISKEQSTLVKENLSGSIKYRVYRKRLTLGATYDLSRFPFDSQTLPITIAHINRNSTHVMLVPDSRHMDDTPVEHINPQEWTFLDKEVSSDLYQYTSTFGDPDYRLGTGYKSRIYFSTVEVALRVRRMLNPYLFTFFLPLVILLAIIMLVLWVPVDQFTPRINASISGLVGVLVYHMSQKNSFPKVGYAVTADYYFILAYVFIVILMMNIISVQILVSSGQKELAKRRNRVFSLTAIGIVSLAYATLTIVGLRG